jgi:hypothetical protein
MWKRHGNRRRNPVGSAHRVFKSLGTLVPGPRRLGLERLEDRHLLSVMVSGPAGAAGFEGGVGSLAAIEGQFAPQAAGSAPRFQPGPSWSPAAALGNQAATDSGTDGEPQLVTDGAGHWVAVWESNNSLLGTIGTDYDIFVSRSTDSGVTWTEPAPLNTNASTDAGSGDGSPDVTTDGNGHWVAVWSAGGQMAFSRSNLPFAMAKHSRKCCVLHFRPDALPTILGCLAHPADHPRGLGDGPVLRGGSAT